MEHGRRKKKKKSNRHKRRMLSLSQHNDDKLSFYILSFECSFHTLYGSFVETNLKLCMVYKFSSCKISLNFEIISSRILHVLVFLFAIYLKVQIELKLKKFNQYKICLK
ncbi:hypothetical protein AAZX31_06G231400 [Glycine max]